MLAKPPLVTGRAPDLTLGMAAIHKVLLMGFAITEKKIFTDLRSINPCHKPFLNLELLSNYMTRICVLLFFSYYLPH